MQTLDLRCKGGHLFTNVGDGDWIVDTGALTSFGESGAITLDSRTFDMPNSYLGLDSTVLSEFVDHSTAGLLGADVLNNFDLIFDVPRGKLSIGIEELSCDGDSM